MRPTGGGRRRGSSPPAPPLARDPPRVGREASFPGPAPCGGRRRRLPQLLPGRLPVRRLQRHRRLRRRALLGRIPRRPPRRDPSSPEIHLHPELDLGAGAVRLSPRERDAPRGERRDALLPCGEDRLPVRFPVRRPAPRAPVRHPPGPDGGGDLHQRAVRFPDDVLLSREPPCLPAGACAGKPNSPARGVACSFPARRRLQGGGAHPSVRAGSLRSRTVGAERMERDAWRPGGPLGAPALPRRSFPRPRRIRAPARGVPRHPGGRVQPVYPGPRPPRPPPVTLAPPLRVSSGWAPALLPEALLLVTLLAAGFLGIKKRSPAGFGVLWFFLHLVPTNSFIPRLDVANERQLYLASWGR